MRISKETIGIVTGFLALGISVFLDCPIEGLSPVGWRAAGLGAMMALWWMTECVPLAVTSFLPIVIAPIIGVESIKGVTPSYSHPLIFLFLGGFLLSLAMEKTGLHLRVARRVVSSIGSSPKSQIGGMMLATAVLSMWMSNTATAIMMLPVAISTARLYAESGNRVSDSFGPTLLLGIAYGASIGGLATLIGTPPNALLAAYLESSYGIEIGFSQWMLFGVPLSAVLLTLAWLALTRKGFGLDEGVGVVAIGDSQRPELEPMSRAELMVLVTFALTASCWMARSYVNKAFGLDVSDTGIAMTAAVLLFLLPNGADSSERLLTWKQAEKVPWGVLVLFGGGLALAGIMKDSGLAAYIGGLFEALSNWDVIWVVAVVSLTVVFLTEVTSNTATAAGMLPLMGPIAISMGEEPTMLAIPAAIIASCAFMLPVATPPNAIVFASGELKIGQMIRAGIALNLVSVIVLLAFVAWLLPLVF